MSRTWQACTATFFIPMHRNPLVNVQISLCQLTKPTWSKHRTLLVNAQPRPPFVNAQIPPFVAQDLPRTPLSPYRTPHIKAPCLIASHPSGVAKLVHCCQFSHDRQSGPSEARRQAPMTAWLCWSQTNHTQPICINCFFPSQVLSAAAIMPGCRGGHLPAGLSVGGRPRHYQPRGGLLRLADALLRCRVRGPHGPGGLHHASHRGDLPRQRPLQCENSVEHQEGCREFEYQQKHVWTNVCHIFHALECHAGALSALLAESCSAESS